MHKSNITLLILAIGLGFLFFACDDPSQVKKTVSTPEIVSGKISPPVVQPPPPKEDKKDAPPLEKTLALEPVDNAKVPEQEADKQEEIVQYDSQGKIDPFRPLIQEKSEEPPPSVVDDRPKRILTPLEKIDLSQIRLVAVIIMKNKQIAMVEEANGKGYEVGIGTYIGKKQGRITEIKSSSIVITELVKDFKGKLKEHVQEIKLHKNDNGE